MPYAFMVFAVAERAVSVSVNPAIANFAEFCIILPKLPIGTDADSALYAASASSAAAIPVELEICISSLCNPSNSSFVPEKRVDAFVMEPSKSMPLVSASLIIFPTPKAAIALVAKEAICVPIVLPAFCPAIVASGLNTLLIAPEIPSADGTICTYAFPSSVLILFLLISYSLQL